VGAGEGTCKVFHVKVETERAVNATCSIIGQGADVPGVTCPLDTASGIFAVLKGMVNEWIIWFQSFFGRGKSYPASAILSKATSCKDSTLQTECMTKEQYDAINDDVGVALQKVKTNLEECNSGNCPEADWAGCVLRMAGHDFMDYDKASNRGGSDGCTDLNFPDNKGLEECLISGEHDAALTDIYEKYCSSISLADFLVVAAEGVMFHTRENVLFENPDAKPVDFKSKFRFGRQTSEECPESATRLPDPEDSCEGVETTFVKRMGLTWRESAALMGVHTLGRARTHNSGYAGWWSDADNSRKFNNNYYESLMLKGWRPMKAVCGNEHKNQWYASGPAGVRQGERTEMMLNSDICLLFSESDPPDGTGHPVNANQSNCCAWFIAHPKTKVDIGSFTEICGLKDVDDCGSIREAAGTAGDHMVEFADSEDAWLDAFMPAWSKAIENGREDQLQPLKDTCP
jgi:hypothetical protein